MSYEQHAVCILLTFRCAKVPNVSNDLGTGTYNWFMLIYWPPFKKIIICKKKISFVSNVFFKLLDKLFFSQNKNII